MTRPLDVLQGLLASLVEASDADAGLGSLLAGDGLELSGGDPVLATRFRIGEAAAAALAGCGGLAAEVYRGRAGHRERQQVRVEVGAAAASLLGFVFQRLEDATAPQYADRRNITDFYRASDGRWVLVHGGFAHLQRGILELLDVPARGASGDGDGDAEALKREVAAAIAGWPARTLEDAIAERGLCGAMVRSEAEWGAHAQGRSLSARPVVEILRLGDSPPEPIGADRVDPPRPLSGLRVLDLTRVLAGPACARTLAAHGAEVLKITGPDLPSIPLFVMDTGHGKRSAQLDLRDASGRARLRELVAGADVFSQGYRPGALARLGFDPRELHAIRPGIVTTSIDCYGHEGPWAERRGWEQLAQTVTGIAHENGAETGKPMLLPAAATDYTTGYLAALGTLAALRRREQQGGSYHVRVSLARTGMWIQSLGRTDVPGAGPSGEGLAAHMTASETPYGRLHHLGPIVEMTATPARWELPTVPLGTHPAAWTSPPA